MAHDDPSSQRPAMRSRHSRFLMKSPLTHHINEKRTASFRRKSIGELKKFVEAKTLSSAAAAYEVARRERTGSGAESTWAEEILADEQGTEQ